MPRIPQTACWLLLACLMLAGCKRATVTKGAGSGNSAGNNGPDSVLGNGQRVALIIGNENYQHLPHLSACRHDAEQMAAVFTNIGIKVHGGKPLLDLSANEMDAALNDFARSLDRGSEAYIYYSGHGAQIAGGNYLLPVNFDAKFESQAKRESIALDDVLALLEKTSSKLRVIILDACRDPGEFLPGEPALKGLHGKGLAEQTVDVPETLVCFATKHGTAALADDHASFYSRILAEEMVKPGKIEEVMKIVMRRVMEATEKRQIPFTYGNLVQDHYFVAPLPVVPDTSTPQPVALATPTPPVDLEAEIQRRVKAEMARLAATPSPPPAATPPMEITKLTPPAPSLTPVAPAIPPAGGSTTPEAATKDVPFINSLGMKFVPVPRTNVRFSVWDTRVQDYAAYAQEKGITLEKPYFEQAPTHPVVEVSWEDAKAFCVWLSQKESRTYRLPTDAEWSNSVGLGSEEGATPEVKSGEDQSYPWGTQWPPPKGAGNFADETARRAQSGVSYIDGYDDGYAYTSPVGSFAANWYGLYDMSGNVWQWCEDLYNAKYKVRVLRGGSWRNTEGTLRSSQRFYASPASRSADLGFRCVVVVSGG